MRIRIGLAACSVAALAIVAVAGCGSGGSTGSTGSAGSGGSSASATPSWAKALGAGVTVVPPGSMATASGSPGAVLEGVVADVQSGAYSKLCSLYQPSLQSQCNSSFASAPASALATAMPTFKNFAVTYTAIDGDKALVGQTGTFCNPGSPASCFTNTDPAAIFKSGKSFAAQWSAAVAASSSTYSLAPTVKVNGTWYLYSSGA